MHQAHKSPIGVFDSGFGGLSVLREIRSLMPEYDYIYLGDNARAPYGTRSFDLIYRFTRQGVERLFADGCPLVILACNTASAKALRSIQQRDLPLSADPTRRVLGVIRPTAEMVADATRTGHIGILATPGTVASGSYDIEIAHLHPELTVTSRACPLWVSLVECGEMHTQGADWFVGRDLDALFAADPLIDTIILGCTHFPLLIDAIKRHVPAGCRIISQGSVVAESLKDYLARHPEMEQRLSHGGTCTFLTTEPDASRIASTAQLFMGHPVDPLSIVL